MVAHGQLRSNPQFEMQENGSKQNLLSPNNEVSENTSLKESCKEMEYYNYLYSNEKKDYRFLSSLVGICLIIISKWPPLSHIMLWFW